MKVGYARVSTKEQKLEVQTDELEKYGCTKLFTDIASGVKTNRKGFEAMLSFARAGDIIVVVRLDRLGRSLKELIHVVNWLEQRNISFVSLSENIDTTTATGKLIFNLFASLADFERNLIIERTKAGLDSARARGKVGGRKKSLKKAEIEHIKILYDSKKFPVDQIAKQFKISRTTLYNYVKQDKVTREKMEKFSVDELI